MSQSNTLLVIGYGNSLRRDDGAGLLLAEQLVDYWRGIGIVADLILAHQLTPDYAEAIADPAHSYVIFVDTRVAEDQESHIRVDPIGPSVEAQSIGHQMGPSMLITYAEQLFGRAPTAYMVTIAGHDFGFGEQVSARVQQTLADSDTIPRKIMGTLSISLP